MLLTSNPYNINNNHTLCFNENEVLRLIGNEQYLEAYTLLKSKPDKNISDTYNLALCCFMTQLYEACLQHISEISSGDLKRLSMKPNANMDEIQQKMESFQTQRLVGFAKTISANYCNAFPYLVSESIIRLKINCFVALRQWDNIINNVNQSIASKYKDINNALAIAKENTNK